MRFIDDKHVPLRLQGSLLPTRVLQQGFDTTDAELILVKWVDLRIDRSRRFTVIGVDQSKPEVKSAQ